MKVRGDSITSSDLFEIGPTNYSQADSPTQPRKHPLLQQFHKEWKKEEEWEYKS